MQSAGYLVGSLCSLGFHNSSVFAMLSPSIRAALLPLFLPVTIFSVTRHLRIDGRLWQL